MNTLLGVAHEHLALGRSLLPVSHDKRPHAGALRHTGYTRPGEDGRSRASWLRLQRDPPGEDVVREWLRLGAVGLGLVTGKVSGVVVLDVDVGEGTARFERWGLTARAHARSPSGGLHWYLAHPGFAVRTIQTRTSERLRFVRGLDVRGDGGYVVLPPTRTPKGDYEALRDHTDPDAADLVPRRVRALLGFTPPEATKPPIAAQPSPPRAPGIPVADELLERALLLALERRRRNEAGFWLAVQARDHGFSLPDAQTLLRRFVAAVTETNGPGRREPYTFAEARRSLGQAYRRPPRSPWAGGGKREA